MQRQLIAELRAWHARSRTMTPEQSEKEFLDILARSETEIREHAQHSLSADEVGAILNNADSVGPRISSRGKYWLVKALAGL